MRRTSGRYYEFADSAVSSAHDFIQHKIRFLLDDCRDCVMSATVHAIHGKMGRICKDGAVDHGDGECADIDHLCLCGIFIRFEGRTICDGSDQQRH